MAAADTVAALARFSGRGAGTEVERQAAVWLRDELRRGGRTAELETFWSRPNWAVAASWHTLLALAGSLLSVSTPKLGGALILVALVSLALDALTGVSPGRRLSRERGSQNVVSPPRGASRPVRLIVTANYDAGRMGLVHRSFFRRPAAALHALTGGRAPGWQAWLALSFVWLLATALLRNSGSTGSGVGVAQLIPTAVLVLVLALLLELAVAQFGPAAGENASGVAVAIALVRALEVSPPHGLEVELLLQGAGEGSMRGLAHHLRRHRRGRRADTVVLGIAAAGAGDPRWWVSDGSFLPLRFARRLRQSAALAAAAGTPAPARAHRGRGVSPAFPARLAGFPALTLGCLDTKGAVPRSHLPSDTPDLLDRGAMDRLLELALNLIDSLDAGLPEPATAAAVTAAAAPS